jgi:hypothetical protein
MEESCKDSKFTVSPVAELCPSQKCTQFLLRHVLLGPVKCRSEIKPGTKDRGSDSVLPGQGHHTVIDEYGAIVE